MALLSSEDFRLTPKDIRPPYVETYLYNHSSNSFIFRSNATAFLLWYNGPCLVTNWHVVTGIDPESPNEQHLGTASPVYLDMFLPIERGDYWLMSIPLYDNNNEPCWIEHHEGHIVDLVYIPLPKNLADYIDVFSHNVFEYNSEEVALELGRNVFIPGFPFRRTEIAQHFALSAYTYLPIWKKASIATNPDEPINNYVFLLDGLSRPGMSGAPVFAAQEEEFYLLPDELRVRSDGENWVNKSSFRKTMQSQTLRLIGFYSGTVGRSMRELALGKCWNWSAFISLLAPGRFGLMEKHKPSIPDSFAARFHGKSLELIKYNRHSTEIDRIILES